MGGKRSLLLFNLFFLPFVCFFSAYHLKYTCLPTKKKLYTFWLKRVYVTGEEKTKEKPVSDRIIETWKKRGEGHGIFVVGQATLR